MRECIDEEAKKACPPQVVYVKQTCSSKDGVEIAQINRCPIYAPKSNSAKVTMKCGDEVIGSFSLDSKKDVVVDLSRAGASRRMSASMPSAEQASSV